MKKWLLVLVCLPAAYVYAAAMQIQTIQLSGRSAEEIIPVLQPLLAPGGSLSGTGYKLIIRSTPDNIEQLRTLLADIDKPPAQLMIFVSDDLTVLDQTRGHAGRITINGRDKTDQVVIGNTPERTDTSDAARARLESGRVRIDAHSSERYQTRREPVAQQMRVTEGLWASIRFGQAVPYATRSINPDGTVTETVTYEPVTSGFQVLPRVNGQEVTLTIKPQRASVGAHTGGAYNVTEVETTLRMRFGEWVEIGASQQDMSSTARGLGTSQRARSGEQQRIFVKIERIQP